MNWLKTHSITVFSFGVGIYMLNTELGIALHWIFGILIVFASLATLLQYGIVAIGWKGAMAHPELFGPGGDSHERTLKLYDWSIEVTRPYHNKINIYISFVADILLMAGLLHQGWNILLGMQFVSCVIGYATITSFLTNFHNIYAFMNGSKA